MNAFILLHAPGFTHSGVDRKLRDIFIRWSLPARLVLLALMSHISSLLFFLSFKRRRTLPRSPAAAEIAHVAPSSMKQKCFLDRESLYFLVPARPLAIPRECLAVSDFSPCCTNALLQARACHLPERLHWALRAPGPALTSWYLGRKGQAVCLCLGAKTLLDVPPLSLSPTSAIPLIPAAMKRG